MLIFNHTAMPKRGQRTPEAFNAEPKREIAGSIPALATKKRVDCQTPVKRGSLPAFHFPVAQLIFTNRLRHNFGKTQTEIL